MKQGSYFIESERIHQRGEDMFMVRDRKDVEKIDERMRQIVRGLNGASQSEL